MKFNELDLLMKRYHRFVYSVRNSYYSYERVEKKIKTVIVCFKNPVSLNVCIVEYYVRPIDAIHNKKELKALEEQLELLEQDIQMLDSKEVKML